jgi:hypothetical protein
LIQKSQQGEEYHLEYIKKIKNSPNPNASYTLHILPYLEKLTQYAMEPDFIPPHSLINFDKRRKFAAILNEINNFQKKAFDLVFVSLPWRKTKFNSYFGSLKKSRKANLIRILSLKLDRFKEHSKILARLA